MRRTGRIRKREDPEALALVAECGAFLTGVYAEHLMKESRPVPAWAWLNAIAHGSPEAVRALGSAAPVGRPALSATAAWKQAVGYLAHEVLCSAEGDDERLRELQDHVLVPLELSLATTVERLDPGRLAWLVLDALERHGSHHTG